MNDIIIDENKAIELLEKAVEERGEDFRYKEAYPDDSGCSYVRDGGYACLAGLAIGYVLMETGQEWLTKGEMGVGNAWSKDLPWNGLVFEALETLQANRGIRITDDAAELFSIAQNAQDAGDTWGDALEEAKGRLAEIPRENTD